MKSKYTILHQRGWRGKMKKEKIVVQAWIETMACYTEIKTERPNRKRSIEMALCLYIIYCTKYARWSLLMVILWLRLCAQFKQQTLKTIEIAAGVQKFFIAQFYLCVNLTLSIATIK